MLVAPFAGIIAGRVGARPLVLAGMAAQAIALFLIGTLASPTVSYLTLLPAFILGGLGMGLTFAPLSEAVMGAAHASRQGQASGAYNTIRELGGVFGIAVLGAVFQHVVILPSQFVDGFRAAVFAGAGIVAIGVVLAVLLPARKAAASAEVSAAEIVQDEIAVAGRSAA
jgi:MFS family permease